MKAKKEVEDCIFCKIVKKESPAKIEYEDKEIIVFWDIKPSAPVHLLVIPKKHISSLNEASEEDVLLLGKLLKVAKEMANKKNIAKSGYKVIINTGAWAGQIVPHLHLHLMGG